MTHALPDRAVLLSLQELTENLSTSLVYTPASDDEARQLIGSLLRTGGQQPAMLNAEPNAQSWKAAARRLLEQLEQDPDTAGTVAEILADPPTGDQLGIETAAADLVVIASIISWLQTKIQIKVTRSNNRWEFEFQLEKQPVPKSVLRQLADVITRVLFGPDKRP